MAITVNHSTLADGSFSATGAVAWDANHTLTGTLPITNGGTGAATATDALNGLLPTQTGNNGKVLATDGTNTSWASISSGTVTSVTGTAPVSVATGTTTPVISLAASYGDTQNPYASKTANYVLASPNGSAGVPTFRALTSSDIPSLSYIPYTGASSAVDLNAQTLVNISNLGVNTTTVPTIRARVVGDNNSTSRIAMRGYSSDANSSAIRVSKFRGTVAAPQAPISGDSLGKFELAGYGTTSADAYPQVSLEGVTTEVWGATARGAKVLIKVTPNTTTTQVTAVTIDQDSKATFASSVTATSFSGSGSSLTGVVTSVTGTAPVVSSGGTTPAISMPAATTSVSGYLTNTDWNTFNGKGTGTVTSVAATVPSFLSVTGSPITSSGTLALTYSGTALPIANGGTGQTTANTALNALLPSQTANTGKVLSTDGTNTSWIASGGSGTVTSVAQTFTGGIISVAGSPITTTGTLALTVAGTSGGIPYFSSATGWASSAALAANALVVGGGAGVAPSTITTGTGVNTALGVNTGSAGAFVVNGGALGTPSSGTVTNLTGTASININGTVGATTATTGAFTTVSATGVITSTVATGTAPFTVASTTQVANLNAATAGTAAALSATLVATSGGTGQSTYAVGDLLVGGATNTLTKLADVATGNSLISGGVGVAPSWGKIGLTTHVSGTLPVANGGTNLTSYAVGDIVYASGTGTLASLADVATGNALISGGVGVAPSYGKIGLTTHVSGTLPIANGGTNATTASITSFNNITGYTASGATGTTSTNLVFSTAPTVTNPTLTGFIETVYAATGTTPALSPTNGTIQTWTLSGSSTPTAGTWTAGASLSLQITASTNTITWSSLPVTWMGGTAPTLSTTVTTNIELWKIGSTIYGALVGLA